MADWRILADSSGVLADLVWRTGGFPGGLADLSWRTGGFGVVERRTGQGDRAGPRARVEQGKAAEHRVAINLSNLSATDYCDHACPRSLLP